MGYRKDLLAKSSTLSEVELKEVEHLDMHAMEQPKEDFLN